MTIGSVLFMIGAGLQAGAVHLGMLIAGRIMLGDSSDHFLRVHGTKNYQASAGNT